MKKILTFLTLMSLTVCNLPGLQPPTDITILSFLLRSLIPPPIEVSIIYNGVVYKPGSTIELGSTSAFEKKTTPVVLKVTGTQNISINQSNPYTLETSSIGVFDIESSTQIPEVWPVGSEYNVSVFTLPDSNLSNEWKFNLNIISPSATVLTYTFKVLSTDVTPGALILSGVNSTVPAESFISAYGFNSTTGTIGSESQMEFGLTNATYRIVRSRDNKFIFFNNSNSTNLRSFRVTNTGAATQVAGSPFVGLSAIQELTAIPYQDRFIAYRGSDTSYYTYSYDGNGIISTTSGPFGALCASVTTISPNGDFLYTVNSVAPTSGDISAYSIGTNGVLTPIGVQNEANLSNRMIIHMRSKLKPYLYTVSHTNTAGANALRIDKVLRRNVNTNGTLGQVDTYFDLPNVGELYYKFIAHPSDKYFYLAGVLGGQIRIKGLKQDLRSNSVSQIFTYDVVGSIAFSFIKISPDGKHLAIGTRNTSCGSPCSTLQIHKINDDGTINTSPSSTLSRNTNYIDFEWGGY